MTDVVDFASIQAQPRQRAASIPLPAHVPFGAPVLIADCVSPLAGETVLSLIWRMFDGTNDERPDQ